MSFSALNIIKIYGSQDYQTWGQTTSSLQNIISTLLPVDKLSFTLSKALYYRDKRENWLIMQTTVCTWWTLWSPSTTTTTTALSLGLFINYYHILPPAISSVRYSITIALIFFLSLQHFFEEKTVTNTTCNVLMMQSLKLS